MQFGEHGVEAHKATELLHLDTRKSPLLFFFVFSLLLLISSLLLFSLLALSLFSFLSFFTLHSSLSSPLLLSSLLILRVAFLRFGISLSQRRVNCTRGLSEEKEKSSKKESTLFEKEDKESDCREGATLSPLKSSTAFDKKQSQRVAVI